jgi:DNA-binding transcriptional ArsR family regulator
MDFAVRISPQFDFCYALADLVSPTPHFRGWPGLKAAPSWLKTARSFGSAFWLGVPDLVETQEPKTSVAAFLNALRTLPGAEILPRLRRSLLHSESATAKPSAAKREWLHFIGLDSTQARQQLSTGSPDMFDHALRVLEGFRPCFEPVWSALEPQLAKSAQHIERLAAECSLARLIEELQLPLDLDEKKGVIRALRGGYELRLDVVGTVYLMPSPFNSRRLWNAADASHPATLFLPCFMADAALPSRMRRTVDEAGSEIDPWLVSRAVGDSTRAAILRMLAERPRSATQLVEELRLSKATISYHIFQLREAGLLTERRVGRTIELAARLGPLWRLSAAFRRELRKRHD